MPDNPLNDIALQKILERLDTLDQKFTGEVRQLDQKFTGEIQSVRGEVQSVGKRVEQLDEKFTGEIRHLDQKVQGVHHELLDFRNASGETWGHILRIVEQSQKNASTNEMQKKIASLESRPSLTA